MADEAHGGRAGRGFLLSGFCLFLRGRCTVYGGGSWGLQFACTAESHGADGNSRAFLMLGTFACSADGIIVPEPTFDTAVFAPG